MASKNTSKSITVSYDKGTFPSFFKKFASDTEEYDFDSLALLRKLLSNEKARLMKVLKTKKPKSIYSLAKLLDRDFKSVSEDIKVLEKFGMIDLIKEKSGKRERLRPILAVETLHIELKI